MNYGSCFSEIYDKIIEKQVDFADYCNFVLKKSAEKGTDIKTALDMGCGSGLFTKQLVESGLEVTAFDLSQDMLCLAQNRLQNSAGLFCADFTDFNLDGQFDAVFCTLDGLNHLLYVNEFKRAVKNAAKHTKSGGAFIFDVNTTYKHREVLANNTFIFDENEFYLAWQCFPHGDTVDMSLDMFVKSGGRYDRFSDDVSERAYSHELIYNTLKDVGFAKIYRYDFETFGKIRSNSEKIIYIAIKE